MLSSGDATERQARIEQRREEFRKWLQAARGGPATFSSSAASDDRRQKRLEALQERLASAEAKREATLEQLKQRAASRSARRKGAAARAAALSAQAEAEAAGRLQADLAAAESRRLALREAERERLRAEHELVFSRLSVFQERAASVPQQQLQRLEERLGAARELREARLARRATRAANKVERARTVGALSRALHQQSLKDRRQALEDKLAQAQQRRAVGAGQAGSGASNTPSNRASLSGVHAAAMDGAVADESGSGSNSCGSSHNSHPQSPMKAAGAKAAAAGEAAARQGPKMRVAAAPQADAAVQPAPAAAAAAAAAPVPEAAAADAPRTSSQSGLAEGGHAPASALLPVGRAGRRSSMDFPGVHQRHAHAALERIRHTISTRRLQKVWRAFSRSQRTTHALAGAFADTGIANVRPASPAGKGTSASPVHAAAQQAEEAAARAAGAVDVPAARQQRMGSGSAAVPPPAVVVGGLSPRRGGGGLDDDKFEQFAAAMRSPATLQAAQALLRRLAARLAAKGVASSTCTPLLRLLHPKGPKGDAAQVERYPTRVFMCAFMIVKHPEVVFSGAGMRERELAAAAQELVDRFEVLLDRILHPTHGEAHAQPGADSPGAAAASLIMLPPSPLGVSIRQLRAASAGGASTGGGTSGVGAEDGSGFQTVGALLVSFDEAWLRYLDQFVAWKGADAAALEGELLRAAVALETSMMRKCRGDPQSERVRRSADLQAVIAQVAHDQELLRERVAKLGGQPGLARLAEALQAARTRVVAEVQEAREQRARQQGGAGADGWSSTAGGWTTTDFEFDDTESEAESARTPPRSSRAPAQAPGRPAVSPPQPLPARAANVMPAVHMHAAPITVPSPRRTPASAAEAASVLPTSSPRLPSMADGATLRGAATPGSGTGSPKAPPARGGAAAGAAWVGPDPAASALLSSSPRSPGALHEAALSHVPLEASSNAQMVVDLMHDPQYKLSSSDAEAAWERALAAQLEGAEGRAGLPAPLDPLDLEAMSHEQMIEVLKSRTKAIAEAAFWANVSARLGGALQQGALPRMLAPLLSETGMELAGLVADQNQAAALRREFGEAAVTAWLEGSEAGGGVGAQVQRTLATLQRLAQLLLQWGAPAREAAAVEAHRLMRQELAAAAAAPLSAPAAEPGSGSGSDAEPSSEGARDAPIPLLAAALGRSVRLLAAQLKLLKVDAANGRLRMLAASLAQGGGAAAYLQGKFATIFRLPAAGQQQQPLEMLLPRATAWLRSTRVAADGIVAYLASQGIDLRQALAAAQQEPVASALAPASAAVPAQLRTGVRGQRTGAASSDGAAAAPVLAAAAVLPVQLGSWRWLVRCGVAVLAASDKPAVGPALAETLLWDAERLHAAQNRFQQLVVVTAGLLLVGQWRATRGSPSGAAAWGPEQRAAARRRLMVVVADPGMQLPDLVSELGVLAGLEAGDTASEERLRNAFMSLLDPASGAFRSIANGLAGALLVHMVLRTGPAAGGHQGLGSALAALLGRIGASGVAEDIAALSAKLLQLCAVNEEVHGPVYEQLCAAVAVPAAAASGGGAGGAGKQDQGEVLEDGDEV